MHDKSLALVTSMANVFEYKKHRNSLIEKQREVLDRAGIVNGEFRSLSAEDKETVDKMAAEVNSVDELIEKLQALQAPQDRSEDDDKDKNVVPVDDMARSVRRRSHATDSDLRPASRSDMLASAQYRAMHANWLRTGEIDRGLLGAQYRDVTVSPNSAGGYLATPTQISDDITMIINNLVFMRKLAKITVVNSAQSLGVRQLTTQPSDANWSTEIAAVVPDTTMAFSRRDLTPNLLVKDIQVSLRELQIVPDVDSLVTERIGFKFSVAEENAFMNGSSSGQPLGLFTASSSGITTAQDVVCSASSSVQITADSLITAKYTLKQPYLQGTSVGWVFSRTAIQQIRLLKDSYGRYLWADGGGFASAPDTILGIPVYISEYCPNTFAAGAYVGILGNFDYYRIADVKDMEIQRLVELYAGTNEVGFIGRRWLDASPVLSEAFARLQLHS